MSHSGSKKDSALPFHNAPQSHRPRHPSSFQTRAIPFLTNDSCRHLVWNVLTCRLLSWRMLSLICIASFVLFLFFSISFLPSFSPLSNSPSGSGSRLEKVALERIQRLENEINEQRRIYQRNNQKMQELVKYIRRLEETSNETRIGLNKSMETLGEGRKSVQDIPGSIHFDLSQVQEGRPSNNATLEMMKNTVKSMMKFAWKSYMTYAWGENELRPITKRSHNNNIFGHLPLGATLIDGLDTLFIMGLQEEYDTARAWIEKSLHFNVASEISVFEFNIRYLGSFLTLYSFTGDKLFLQKAKELANALLPAFNTPTGLPMALINLQTGASRNYQWASGSSILSEFGTLHMEFAYLSELTGDSTYLKKVQRIREVLNSAPARPHGLYPYYLNPRTNQWGQMFSSLAGMGDSFYEYLIKEWVRTGGKDKQARDMYEDTMRAMEKWMFKKSPTGLFYVGDYKYGRIDNKMDHLACFAGGMFSLAATTFNVSGEENLKVTESEYYKKWFSYATSITHTCRESYVRTATQLGPESFHFGANVEAVALEARERAYLLRPETVESYFYLWRYTHEQKYRDWAWDVVQALEKHCRVEAGYSGIKDVSTIHGEKDDVQQSYFLAETLKYLYLIFSDDDLLSLDRWVFNTEAHPFPIRGRVNFSHLS